MMWDISREENRWICLSRVAIAEADVLANCSRTVLANSLYC